MVAVLKRSFKHLFRYPISTIYIILGLLVAFMALFDGVNIYSQVLGKANDDGQYNYKYAMYLQIDTQGGGKNNIKDLISDRKVNVKICNFAVWPEGSKGMPYMDIILTNNEKEKYVLKEGRLPDDAEIKARENVVLVGDSYLSKLTRDNKGNRFITINGSRYKVVGIMDNNISPAFSANLVTFYECLSDDMKQKILNSPHLDLMIESDSEDVYPVCEQIKADILKRDPQAVIEGYKVDYKEQQAEAAKLQLAQSPVNIYFLIYFFAIINCIIVSEFWIEQRKREIAIRKAFGMSNLQIIGMLFREMLGISCFAAILCVFLQIIFSKLIGNIFNIYIGASFGDVITMIAMIVATSLAVILVPVYKIINMSPSQAVIS
ncbi:ABC transporter permease [Mahella australiensis]|uniref:ABC3 transporter permease C-terminal domain-containing protein n=1 Tax=Mahella australiensis (strain DSM 15567 / CIP 107919 / 50-1 BON) TaxID=697281 RepID=F4A022_MAHA5|nr:FtsX-like permease family protein [Mahella australiensis]AEE95840.1 protein of unknown function DUF214 [Mahella australiensis 50-1 BON]